MHVSALLCSIEAFFPFPRPFHHSSLILIHPRRYSFILVSLVRPVQSQPVSRLPLVSPRYLFSIVTFVVLAGLAACATNTTSTLPCACVCVCHVLLCSPPLSLVPSQDKAQGSRKYSHMLIKAIADSVPEFMGGSADLTGSNNTDFK